MRLFLKKIKLKWILWNQKNLWQMPMILIAVLLMVLSIFLGSLIYQSEKLSLLSAHQQSQSDAVLNDLQVINNQIQELSQHSNNSTDLTKIKNEIENIQSELLTKNDVIKISSQMADFRNDMDTQMNSLEKNIAGGTNKIYLDEKVLPFKVLSIDVISGQAFITVDYQHHQTALQIGECLVNWKIMSADYQDQSVEFQNNKSQFVKVVLQG